MNMIEWENGGYSASSLKEAIQPFKNNKTAGYAGQKVRLLIRNHSLFLVLKKEDPNNIRQLQEYKPSPYGI